MLIASRPAQATGAPSVPATGGTSIGAGETVYLAWTVAQGLVELQNNSGGDWLVWYNVTAATIGSRPYHLRLKSDGHFTIRTVRTASLAIKASAATELAGASQNSVVQAWLGADS
jgi:hypothetical protein